MSTRRGALPARPALPSPFWCMSVPFCDASDSGALTSSVCSSDCGGRSRVPSGACPSVCVTSDSGALCPDVQLRCDCAALVQCAGMPRTWNRGCVLWVRAPRSAHLSVLRFLLRLRAWNQQSRCTAQHEQLEGSCRLSMTSYSPSRQRHFLATLPPLHAHWSHRTFAHCPWAP